MATTSVHHLHSFPTSYKSTPKRSSKSSIANSVRCCTTATTETPRITVQKGNDSLDICRVLNGMWQTSGGWGRIDRDDAVEAMLRYADNGLSTFDMADHCKHKQIKPNWHFF